MNSCSLDWQKIISTYLQKNRSKLSEKKSFYRYQSSTKNYPSLPEQLKLRDYQQQAVVNWFKNKGRGTLKMATGSGKTITALAIATELYEQIGLEILLVICPSKHLVLQWAKSAQEFNLVPLLAFNTVYDWQSELSSQLYNIQQKQQKFLTIIVTNSTFITQRFQSQLTFFSEKTLIIGDEAHNLGSPRLLASLPKQIGLRLALSATPERYFDEDGTDSLIKYFGQVLAPEFTLAKAIASKALVKYNYYPILVELTTPEIYKYAQLTKRIGWALNEEENTEKNLYLKSLLIKRARLIATAENKLVALKELMKQRQETKATLFYCGDGHTSQNEKQLEAVTRILGKELHYRVNTYTAETPVEEREKIQQQLITGELQGIVAIKCLDEGIDIPMIENAVILASGSNPRQFIQRRGRILRPHPNKKEANLFDMIVTPPFENREVWEIEKHLLKKELRRLIEFAKLAKNASHAQNILVRLSQECGVIIED